jgi:dienelactone hydrolase
MSPRTLCLHLLRALSLGQREGVRHNLDSLVAEVRARRPDVRRALTQLHQEGLLDVTTMRLTLSGFAVGASLANRTLPALRTPKLAAVVAA